MLIWTLIFAVVIVNALFGHTVFGIDARTIVAVFIMLFIVYWVSFSLFHKEMFELLIERENITVVSGSLGSDINFPIYGKNDQYYYAIYPAIHHRIALKNNCLGFRSNNIDTWCGDAQVLPRCNTPEEPDNCIIILK